MNFHLALGLSIPFFVIGLMYNHLQIKKQEMKSKDVVFGTIIYIIACELANYIIN